MSSRLYAWILGARTDMFMALPSGNQERGTEMATRTQRDQLWRGLTAEEVEEEAPCPKQP